MTSIEFVAIETEDVAAAERFYAAAFGEDDRVRVRASDASTAGFRGFTLSLIVSQPANADLFLKAALDAGATSLKPAKKSFWGYGGIVRAPDGTIWQVSTSQKKNTEPPVKKFDQIVLLLGVTDVAGTKQFYSDRGLPVEKSYGRKYVEFKTPPETVDFALYSRPALAKVAGVSPEGVGSHRLVIGGGSEGFVDPDGFEWSAE